MSSLEVLAGESDILSLQRKSADPIFDKQNLIFLNELSKSILRNRSYKEFTDIVAFAFFIRKANLNSYRKIYKDVLNDSIGRGLVFHIAPSNVPINFAYSLAAGLCSGNNNIIKVSSKEFLQTDIICDELSKLFSIDEFSCFKKKISIVRYDKNQEINRTLSEKCDARIIWGGDNTVRDIRKFPIQPRSIDITFPDRFSICIVDSKNYLQEEDKTKIAEGFYNDTYFFDQNACTSPRLIYWLGNTKDNSNAQDIFYKVLKDMIKKKNYEINSWISSNRVTSTYMASIDLEIKSIISDEETPLTVVTLKELQKGLYKYNSPGGVFFQYNSKGMNDLVEIIDQKFQTLSYISMDQSKIKNFIIANGAKGVDRIAKNGTASNFSFHWDGYDLIRQMSRLIA